MRNKFPWNMLLGLDPNLVGSPFRNKQKSAELEMFLQQHQKRQVPTSAKLRYLARFFFKWFFWWVVLRPSAHGSIHPPAALDGENRSPSSKGYALGLSETRGMAWLKSPLKKKKRHRSIMRFESISRALNKVDEKIAVCDKTRFPSQKCLDEFYTQTNKNAHVENEEEFRNP